MAIGLILALALLWPTEAAQRTIIEAYNHAATTATDEATDTKEEEQVLDVDNTKFLIDPSDCTSSNSSRLFFLVLVHSSAEHFDRREIIRKTWGSIQHFQGQAIKVLFLVGKQPNYNKAKSMRSPKMDVWERRDHEAPSIVRESQIYGDIIQGDFLDITQNLSHKQMMGFKWVRDHCCHNTLPPVLVLKTDDDVFVEVFHLFKFAQAIYGGKPGSQSLICDVIPSGTAPRRSGRWEVRSKQHPDYCSGVAYLMTPDLAEPFLLTAQEILPLAAKAHPDDIFVLGYVREALSAHPLYLNPRYTYDELTVNKWLASASRLTFPYIFASLHSLPDSRLFATIESLWHKTLMIHHRVPEQQ